MSFQEWPVRLQGRQGFAQSWRGVAPTPPWRSSAAPNAKCQVWHVWIRARLEQWTINLDAQQIRGLEKSNDLIQSFKLHRVSLNSWRDRKTQYMHTTGSIYHQCNESMSNIHLQSKVGLKKSKNALDLFLDRSLPLDTCTNCSAKGEFCQKMWYQIQCMLPLARLSTCANSSCTGDVITQQ